MADPRQAALPVAVLDDAQDEILPTATRTRSHRSAAAAIEEDIKLGEEEKPSGSIEGAAQDDDVAALPEEEYRRDGGWKAWSTVTAGFLFSEHHQLQLDSKEMSNLPE